jgi:hypothetical protein
MIKPALAALFYAAAFTFIYAAFAGMPDAWDALGAGWPQSTEEIVCALLILNGCAAKLMGHVMLLSTARAK